MLSSEIDSIRSYGKLRERVVSTAKTQSTSEPKPDRLIRMLGRPDPILSTHESYTNACRTQQNIMQSN